MSRKNSSTAMVIVRTNEPEETRAVVVASGMEVIQPLPKIGRIGKSKLTSGETLKKLREEVQFLGLEIQEHYSGLGGVLADPENLGWVPSQIAEEEQQLVDAVLGTSAGKPREVVTLACAQAMLMYFPQTLVGLNHFADHGVAIGFFQPWQRGDLQYFVDLPVGPDYKWTRLRSSIPNSLTVLAPLTAVSQAVLDAERNYERNRLAHFRELAASMLGVIAEKNGDTAFHVVHFDGPDRIDHYVKVQIVDGWVTALDFLGTPQTEALVGSAIPLDSLEHTEPNYRFDHRALKGMTPQQVGKMSELRRFALKAIVQAKRVAAARESAKATPTQPASAKAATTK